MKNKELKNCLNKNKENVYINCLTTESVSEGHPDKLADQIAEIVLDHCVKIDQDVHVGCEVLISGKNVVIAGEIKSNKFKIDRQFEKILQAKIENFLLNEIKYCEISWKGVTNLKYHFLFAEQSQEINALVQKTKNTGAGDNCSVFGYAEENDNQFFPKFQTLAHSILKEINLLRKNDLSIQKKCFFAPDGKIQILFKEKTVKKIVLCQQFLATQKNFLNKKAMFEEIKTIIRNQIITPLIKKLKLKNNFVFRLQPFFEGGPKVDSGLTGRKLIVDNYGTFCYHGGGNFSGKDYTKTDRTLALFARFIAKHLVAAKLSKKIILQVSSTIGLSDLVNITVFNSHENENKKKIDAVIAKFFTWNIKKIIYELKLHQQKFTPFAKYGYFGRENPKASWEKLVFLEDIKKYKEKNNWN